MNKLSRNNRGSFATSYRQRQRFGIRKLSLGVGSVLLGMSFLTSPVSAEEIQEDTSPSIVEVLEQDGQVTDEVQAEETSAAPSVEETEPVGEGVSPEVESNDEIISVIEEQNSLEEKVVENDVVENSSDTESDKPILLMRSVLNSDNDVQLSSASTDGDYFISPEKAREILDKVYNFQDPYSVTRIVEDESLVKEKEMLFVVPSGMEAANVRFVKRDDGNIDLISYGGIMQPKRENHSQTTVTQDGVILNKTIRRDYQNGQWIEFENAWAVTDEGKKKAKAVLKGFLDDTDGYVLNYLNYQVSEDLRSYEFYLLTSDKTDIKLGVDTAVNKVYKLTHFNEYNNYMFDEVSVETMTLLTELLPGDSDGDSLPDLWELWGIDNDADGKKDIRALANFGADVNVPDIFVEVDTMKDVKYRLGKTQYQYMYNQFKKSRPEVDLPNGINLHIDAGEDSWNFALNKQWKDLGSWDVLGKLPVSQGGEIATKKLAIDTTSYKDWEETVEKNFDKTRLPVFRHGLIVDQQFYSDSTASGVGITPGSFFIVWADAQHIHEDEIGNINGLYGVMGTFMHELGHTLGLHHGGDEGTGFKPNYLSVMNYLYQSSGLLAPETDRYNYSESILDSLHMRHLDETKGIGDNNNNVFGIRLKYLEEKNWIVHALDFFKNKYVFRKTYGNFDIDRIDWNGNGKFENDVQVLFADNEGNRLKDDNGNEIEIINSSINDWDLIRKTLISGKYVGNLNTFIGEQFNNIRANEGISKLPEELTIEELTELSKIGEFGDIVIQPLTYDFNEGNKHTISLNVINLYPQDTIFTITLSSDKWSSPLVYNLEAKGDKGIMTDTNLEITLEVPLTAGEFEINYLVQQENGKEYEFIHVVEIHQLEDENRKLPQKTPINIPEPNSNHSQPHNLENKKGQVNSQVIRGNEGQFLIDTNTISTSVSSSPINKVIENKLPNTGEASSVITLIGLGLTYLGLVGRKRRQN